MNTKPIKLLLAICLLASCQQNQTNIFDFETNNKPTYKIQSTKKFFNQILSPYKIYKTGGFLVVVEDGKIPFEKPVMHLVNQHDMTYSKPKGKNGIGPNEITDAYLVDPGFSDSTFWVNSSKSKRMAEFSLYDNSILSKNEFVQPENMMTIYQMYKASDSTYLCLATTDKNIFNEYDIHGNRIAGYGNWPSVPNHNKVLGQFNEETQNFLLGRINGGWFKKDPYSSLFILAMAYRDRLEFFDYKEKKHWFIENPKSVLPSFRIMGSGSNVMAAYSWDTKFTHRDIAFGETYIYDLYGGYSENEFKRTSKIAETIFVMTKKGQMVSKLELDRSVISIAVDETLGKIYGITTDEDPGIAVFDMPQELLELLQE